MRFAVLIPMLLALSPGLAQAGLPGWWRDGAVWAGDGVQVDGIRWSIEIALAAKDASVGYPSIPCGGRLEVLSSTAETVTLRETITAGTDVCISGGTVVLRVDAGGSLMFDWQDETTGLTAKAILAPPLS